MCSIPQLDYECDISITWWMLRLQPGLTIMHINQEQNNIKTVLIFITSIVKSLVILAIWLPLSGSICSQIALFFALSRIFFSANENKIVKQNNQSHDAITSRWHDADLFSKWDVNAFVVLLFDKPATGWIYNGTDQNVVVFL